jgi:hypothetical protein
MATNLLADPALPALAWLTGWLIDQLPNNRSPTFKIGFSGSAATASTGSAPR